MDEKTGKILEHRRYVLREFIESEREYVRRLDIAVEDYYSHIKSGNSENTPPELKNDILSIFSTLPEIFAFHKSTFLPKLEACNWQEDADDIMDCFLKHRSDFHVYLAYCKNKPTSDSVRVEYDKYFASRQTELGHKLNIEDLLIAPVQRLPKYQLLIRDLLKDTRKAGLETAKIQEALELMMKIPQETNNIICMSLIRGIHRASIISHGSLWRQNTLAFSCTATALPFIGDQVSGVNTQCNGKSEPRQVFLFDHRILVTAPSDSDGFFEYQMDFKTLNGRVAEESDNSTFSFTTENNVICYFKASSPTARKEWVKDIRDILDSQTQMKKALVFGKSAATGPQTVRMHSLGVEWSDSDSSIDSMPSSEDEKLEEDDDLEDDWPKDTGYQRVSKPIHINQSSRLTVPDIKINSKKSAAAKRKDMFRSISLVPSFKSKTPETERRRATEGHVVVDRLVLDRPLSCNLNSISEFDQNMQRRSNALSISPRMLRSWVARKCSTQTSRAHIYFPTHTTTPSFDGIRSPGSKPHDAPPSHDQVLFITTEDPPDVAKQLYRPQLGQVFLAEDVSQVEVWKVKALSGDVAGMSVWVQRNCLEEYSAPISLRPLKKEYRVLHSLSVGRFSKLKLAKSKSTKDLHALKMFQSSTTEDQFYRELCIGVRMKHRNLVCYYSGLQHQQTMAISMEYINGRVLFDFLLHKPSVTEQMIVGLMHQLLDGLHYMHSHTVYHLDIRPENVMVDLARDVLKIIDYGAARHSGGMDEVLSQNFETCYNYEYVPPEIFQQIPVGPGTDIWGVGLIVFIIFYGVTPFHGESSVRIIANITRLQYSFPDLDNLPFSQHAAQLIKDILVLSPSKRPNAEAAKKYSWFNVSGGLSENRVKLHLLKQFVSKHS